MRNITKGITYFKENGVLLFLARVCRKACNFVYSFLAFGRTDINIDWSARIKGASCICFGQNFYAGRGLWLDAVTHYRDQKFEPKIIFGDNVSMQDYVHIAATNYVAIGNNVMFASKVYLSDHNHGTYEGNHQSGPLIPPFMRNLTSDKSVIIEDNVWIGEMVSIMPGVKIGQGSIIGSNAIVTKSIPPFSIAVGVPAKVIKTFDNEKLMWVTVK
jgi:lipopolysaccharide O-acetyltransferase